MNNQKKLAGKVALVTGGSRGLGAAISLRLADQGATVAITYSSSAVQANEIVLSIKKAGGKAVAIKADSGNPEDIRKAVSRTIETFSSLDILVNNAGAFAVVPFDKFTLEDLDRMIAVNIRGVFVATQEAVRHMREGGRVINIGSSNSTRSPYPGVAAYSLTKGAVAAFTKGLARDLGPRGITVNNVQPGPTDTEMNPADGALADMKRKFIALGRYGEPEEIASLVTFLATLEASFITGASLLVDGGYAA
jgi:3-oxoacyl-[acyl-carrier protein] reductase